MIFFLVHVIFPMYNGVGLVLKTVVHIPCGNFFRSAPEEGLCCKPKYRANLFKYTLLVLAILFFRHFRRQNQSSICILHFR